MAHKVVRWIRNAEGDVEIMKRWGNTRAHIQSPLNPWPFGNLSITIGLACVCLYCWSIFWSLPRFLKSAGFHLTPKQTCVYVHVCVCACLCTCVCVSICPVLPRATPNRISCLEIGWEDGGLIALRGRWSQMHVGSSQISRGFLINKVIADNGAIRAWLYPCHQATTHRCAFTCNFYHPN